MSLNAHMAFFETFATPDALIPATGSPEAAGITIAGTSQVVPANGPAAGTPPVVPTPPATEKWIELTEVQFCIRSDAAEFHNVEVTKPRDVASPLLALHCAKQTSFKSVKILILNPNGAVTEVMRLYGVKISSVRAAFLTVNTASLGASTAIFDTQSGNSLTITSNPQPPSQMVVATEALALSYKQVVWNHVGANEHGWDRSTNKPFAAPAP